MADISLKEAKFGDKPKAALTETDVLFELFLPLLCEMHETQLAHLRKKLLFLVGGDEMRCWSLSGGEKPWVKRAKSNNKCDTKITIGQDLVNQVIQGREPDIEKAIDNGLISFEGDISALKDFEFVLADAQSVLQTFGKNTTA